jgi:hypothetical protein
MNNILWRERILKEEGNGSVPFFNHCRCKCNGNTVYQPKINGGNFNSLPEGIQNNFVSCLSAIYYTLFCFTFYTALS